jgi:hypothetical protein
MSCSKKCPYAILMLFAVANLGLCETPKQPQKVSSTTTNPPPFVLSESQQHQMVCLVATNLLPLMELQIDAECFWVARFLHNYPTDQQKQTLLQDVEASESMIYNHTRGCLMPFPSWEQAIDEMMLARSFLEQRRENAVRDFYGLGGGPDLPYEDVLKIAKPSLRISHAIMSSYYKAKMYSKISEVLLGQLKDKDELVFNAVTNTMRLIELDKQKSEAEAITIKPKVLKK